MKRPILSIITVNLNNQKGLIDTLNSLQKQSFKSYEHIIIDGGSTDNSKEIIKEYEKENTHLTYWISEKDKGIYNAMNKGIMQAKGEYLLFLNSGDYLEDDILHKVSDQITGESLIYGNLFLVSTTGEKRLQTFPDSPLNVNLVISDDFYLPHPATLIKRYLFENDMYNENYKIVSDWEFWIKCILFKDCSTKHINIGISSFMEGGLSSDTSLAVAERQKALVDLLSPKILASMHELADIQRSPLYEAWLIIRHTKRFQQKMKKLILFCYKIRCFINK